MVARQRGDEGDLTAEMEKYAAAGIGGLEITPIYGVRGDEEDFIEYLSPQWMDMFEHTLREAERLGMQIDMSTGTGWPFGGPWVEADTACRNLVLETYELSGGRVARPPGAARPAADGPRDRPSRADRGPQGTDRRQRRPAGPRARAGAVREAAAALDR